MDRPEAVLANDDFRVWLSPIEVAADGPAYERVLTDPNLKDGHPDLLDGGKVFIEISLLISLTATAIRLRFRGQGFRRQSPAHPASQSTD